MKKILILAALLGLIAFSLGISGCTSVATERIGNNTIDLRYHQYQTVDDSGIKGIARIWNYNGQVARNVTIRVVFLKGNTEPIGSQEFDIGDMTPGQPYPFTITCPKSNQLEYGSKKFYTVIYFTLDNTSYSMNPSFLPLPAD